MHLFSLDEGFIPILISYTLGTKENVTDSCTHKEWLIDCRKIQLPLHIFLSVYEEIVGFT